MYRVSRCCSAFLFAGMMISHGTAFANIGDTFEECMDLVGDPVFCDENRINMPGDPLNCDDQMRAAPPLNLGEAAPAQTGAMFPFAAPGFIGPEESGSGEPQFGGEPVEPEYPFEEAAPGEEQDPGDAQ